MASMATTWSAVNSTGSPIRAPMASMMAVADRRVGGCVDGDLRRRVAHALAAPGDHPELEREQFIEREPAQGGVAARERRREVRLLDRPGDRDQLLGGDDVGRQVLRVGVACLVERLPDGRPQPDGGQAGGQRVDRDDPTDMEQLRLAELAGEDLELRVVEGQPPPEMLDLPGHDHLCADRQPPLDEPAAEPGGVDRARVVLEAGDGPLRPATEPGLDPEVADAGLGGDDLAVGDHEQVAELGASPAGRRIAAAGGRAGRARCRSRA